MSNSAIGFYPIQGKESVIMNLDYHEGCLYFATDTKKIYLDAKGKSKMPMGGNSGIYYGKMELDETPDENQKEFSFTPYDLEINSESTSLTIPNVDDLILNIPDGCFYRVSDIEGAGEDIEINTIKLTIAGGGGNLTGPGSLSGVVFNRITQQNISTLLNVACPIQFTVTATDTSGELTGPGSYRLLIDNVEKARGEIINNNPEIKTDINEIDVAPYLHTGDNTVKVIAAMDAGGSSSVEVSKTWYITVTAVSVKWTPSFTDTYSTSEDYELTWDIVGGPGIEKTTHIIIDNGQHELEYTTTSTGTQTEYISPEDYGLGHGVHKFELYVSVTVGSTTQSTDSIIKNIMFVEENNNNYIINYDFYDTSMIQYNTVEIPIAIYGASNTDSTASVIFKENGSEKGIRENLANGEIHTFSYTPINHGPQILSFLCGTTEVTLVLDVDPIGIELKETPNYVFKFKANDFADNNSVQNWKQGDIGVSFSDRFDWVNGGLDTEKDEKGNVRQFVCVKAGSTMEIDYSVFGDDARDKGKCLKIIFKATKCKDYDAQILSCHDGVRGLVMNAQNAIFNSSNIELKVPYCEDNYIEFELDIASTAEGKYYIRPWIDGIPAGIKVYNKNDDFYTSADNKLVIGSEDCDVYIYLIKLYEKHLTDEQHLNNFIADAPNATEIVSRYNRNNILDENRGDISPTLLAAANPDCRVHVYTMDRMTKTKRDPVENCKYIQYHGSGKASLTANNVTVKVQGTSSAAYGLAAFNLDSKFNDGFTDEEGRHIDKWAMNTNSIPVNYFCTKVNVASAEGANNALNQEWYNRYQPYKTVVRGKNPKARDTMEFTPGVLFIEDLNPERNDTEYGGKGDNVFKDDDVYCASTTADGKKLTSAWPKMYSVCNMGNSKDNIEVFHDLENPKECCVENGDNQYPGQWMTTPQGAYEFGDKTVVVDIDSIEPGETTLCPDGIERSNRELWETGMDSIYSFRYPDGIEDVKKLAPEYAESMITGWFRFVHWMAHSNPSEKYATITFEDGWVAEQYKTEEDFYGETHEKHILNSDTNEYEPVSTYENADTVYYIFLTAPEKFERHPKSIFILSNDNLEDKNKHLGTHIEVERAVENYNPEETYYYITAHIYGATNEPIPTETVPAKTFTGYKAPGELSQYQSDYTPVLANHTESGFAGTYNYDTTNYRIAKMLLECEDYLCMDSVVFHYLFIERHSMVDNVAKNTFWSTEDGLVWNLTKDYDNDTSDGNNNQGKLELTYGLEPGDVDAGGTSIFNAGNSVWLKFIRSLYSTCQKMYQSLDVSRNGLPSPWSPEAYLQLFKEWQSAIPERCWIEDYYRKYIRPYEVYKDDMFLEMHEGGKKTYQREQYELYQNYYISSKYFGNSCSTNFFTLRPNGQDLSNFRIPITLYADCYVHGAFGTGGPANPNFSQRCKRNTVVEMVSPIDNATDATTYLFPANLYQTLGNKATGLNNLKLEQFTVTSAKKLRTLSLGVQTSSIENTALTSFGIQSCENLEELYVAKMKNSSLADLDLTQAPAIKHVDARDSAFTSIIIPSGAPLKTLLVNKPNSVILSKLTELQTISFQDPSKLTKVDIDDIDKSMINSKDNIIDLTSNLTNARALNVDWILKTNQVNNIDEINTADNTIRILEVFKDTEFRDEGKIVPKSSTLSGVLTIPSNIYNDSNSIKIYNKYIAENEYPNLDIIFEGELAKLPKVTIYNGNNEICWYKRISYNTKMTSSFLEAGPKGAFSLAMISKQPSMSATYTFENEWKVYNSAGKEIGTISNSLPIYLDNIQFDIFIKPVFTFKVRQYDISFYTYNNATGKVDKPFGNTIKVDYGTPLSEILPKEIPWKQEDSAYGLKEANNFIGYGLTQKSLTPVKNDYTVSNDQSFYAIFERVDDITKIVHNDWFDFVPYTYAQELYFTDVQADALPATAIKSIEGYYVIPKQSMKLSGKITVPSIHPTDKKPVVAIGSNFAIKNNLQRLTQNITHIFCAENSSIYEIKDDAFRGNTMLQYFDFSQNTVRYIGSNAFFNNTSLNAELTSLSTDLFFVGMHAFNGAFTASIPITFVIPGNVSLVNGFGFANFALPQQSIIQVGTKENPSKLLATYPYPLEANSIRKFIQNEQIKSFKFWTSRYSAMEDKLLNRNGSASSYQLWHIFIKDTDFSNIENFVVEINGKEAEYIS